jgi:outer membrane biosynthesis protein TonB
LESGRDRGCCGNAFRPGNGVEPARPLRQVHPVYTPEAVQARIQGAVWLEFVVLADGTVGSIRVVRSLDARLGLD